MPLLNRRRILTAAIETTYGTDAAPTGSNAVLVRNMTLTPAETDLVDRDLVRPFLGRSEQLAAGIRVRLEFEVELAGAGTAGQAPGYGALLRACGLSQTLLAAAVTGTAAAGAANTITLAAGASSVDGFYNGMPIAITGGTGSGQNAVITGYVGSTRVATVARAWTTPPNATSTYSIDANAIYRPVSTAFESATLYFNVDGVRHRMLGARGSLAMSYRAKEIPTLRFTFLGIYATPTDATLPTPVYTPFQTPLPVNNVNTPLFHLHGVSPVMSELTSDLAVATVHRTLVGGSESVLITDRQPTGQAMIEAELVAFRDWWTRSRDATLDALALTHGLTAGNRVTFSSPRVQVTTPNYGEMDQITMLQLNLNFVPGATSGNDELALCIH
jgi:hypothetical protein